MNAVEDAVRGSIKVGRWIYPAIRTESGTVARNTKRDGSGDWVDVDPKDASRFEADESGVPAAKAEPKGDAPKIDGFSDEHTDYDDLRVAYGRIFDDFAVSYEELADALGADLSRARAVVRMLQEKELVVVDKNGEGDTVVQSVKTYDDHTRDEVMADFAEAFQPGVKIRKSSGHGSKPGAQTKKPGKSRWEVGSRCPQGHLLKEGDIYTMPSGRKQCRKCRHGYSSNVAAPKAS